MIAAIVMDGAPWVIDALALAFVWLLALAVALGLCMTASDNERGSDGMTGPLGPSIVPGPRTEREMRARRIKSRGLSPTRADQRGVRRDRVR